MSFYTLEERPLGYPWTVWVTKWWESQNYAGWRRSLEHTFMLQGTTQDSDIRERHYKISRKKAILFPVINWIGPNLEQAKEEIDIISRESFDVTLDQKSIGENAQRVSVPWYFEYQGKHVVTDGYWIFIKPNSLDKGTHTINSFGSCRSGTIQIAINYSLEIK